MSECVVRMEMPKNCLVCPFGRDGYIWNENDARTYYVRFCSRHDDDEELYVSECETIDRPWYCDSFICQLPEGHGRLVDADEDVSNYITVWDCKCSEFGKQTVMAVDDMKYLPTIVPAERSET